MQRNQPPETVGYKTPGTKPIGRGVDLQFNFDLGDMWKWLGGPYTNEHQNWGNFHTLISQISEIPPSQGDPILEYDLAFRACTKGVPLKGHLISDLNSC
jgi:hypothetical protein